MNIIWIFIDSVRRYYSEDDRSRLKIMDKFKAKSIEFTDVVTSAPSTVMSISAMMTGCHSYILGTNYNDFRFNRKEFPSLTSILKSKGWDCNAILMHPDIREKLTCLDIYPRRKWPKNFSHGVWWSNNDIYNFLNKVLKNEKSLKSPKNKFWFIDYNCRKDPKISVKVENTINLFYENGYNHENSIFILCSDHGYPDPSRGITPELLKKKKMTHDIFMTDDNIMIPFFLSLPGFDKNIKFEQQISSINLFPTILDYLNIQLPNSNIQYANSLIPYFNQEKSEDFPEKFARCDARFLGQSNRVCCIRSKNHKLIYDYDNDQYSYNLIDGLKEKEILNNQIKDFDINEIFKNHKNFLSETDSLAIKMFHYKFRKKIKKILEKFPKSEIIKVILYSNAIKKFNDPIIDLLDNEFSRKFKIEFEFHLINANKIINKKITKKKFQLKILLQTDDNNTKPILSLFHQINSKYMLIIPTSLTGEILQGRFKRAFKTIWNSRVLYLHEPLLIIKLLIKLIKNK